MDVVLALAHKTDLVWWNKRVLSALFIAVKGVFDNVVMTCLLEELQVERYPQQVLQWIQSFLTDRSIAISFDGIKEPLYPVNTGIPQGSRISPILFLIYLHPLFNIINQQHPEIWTPLYTHDYAVIINGKSEEQNAHILDQVTQTVFTWGNNNAVAFNDLKSELIHFHNLCTTNNIPITLPNHILIIPSKLLR